MARLVNTGGDPCHDQQLLSALCFSPMALEEGFFVRTVYEAGACGAGESSEEWCLEVLPGVLGLEGALGFVWPFPLIVPLGRRGPQGLVLCEALNLPQSGAFSTH